MISRKVLFLGILSCIGIIPVLAQTLVPENEYREVQFYDFDLDIQQDGNLVEVTWDDFPNNTWFQWYKLLYSVTVENPVYPDQSAIYVGTDRLDTQNSFYLKKWYEKHYIRICAITQDESSKGRYCSKTQVIETKIHVSEKWELPKKTETKYYVGGIENCKTIKFRCEDGWNYFWDTLWCGCEKKEAKKTEPVICTMEYAPVCGQPKIVCPQGSDCIRPLPVTYSNKCMLLSQGATYLSQWECQIAPNTRIIALDEIMKQRIESAVENFISRLESKNYSHEKNIQILDRVIDRLEQLGKKEKYTHIVSYMVSLLEEYKSEIDADFSELEDILNDF